MPLSTVSGILTRIGMGGWPARTQAGERYEHQVPGALIHIDVKKLGRIRGLVTVCAARHPTGVIERPPHAQGWEYVQSRSTTAPAGLRRSP